MIATARFRESPQLAAEGPERAERAPPRYGKLLGGRTAGLVAEVIRRVREQEPVRILKNVLEELEFVPRYTRAEDLNIPTVRHVAMERRKPALVVWIDEHEREYGRGLLNGFLPED